MMNKRRVLFQPSACDDGPVRNGVDPSAMKRQVEARKVRLFVNLLPEETDERSVKVLTSS